MYKINIELVNQILNYLTTKPYNEVNSLISGFSNPALFEPIASTGTPPVEPVEEK